MGKKNIKILGIIAMILGVLSLILEFSSIDTTALQAMTSIVTIILAGVMLRKQ